MAGDTGDPNVSGKQFRTTSKVGCDSQLSNRVVGVGSQSGMPAPSASSARWIRCVHWQETRAV